MPNFYPELQIYHALMRAASNPIVLSHFNDLVKLVRQLNVDDDSMYDWLLEQYAVSKVHFLLALTAISDDRMYAIELRKYLHIAMNPHGPR